MQGMTAYEQLWRKALRQPRSQRAGIEARMRRVWNAMTPAERKRVEARCC